MKRRRPASARVLIVEDYEDTRQMYTKYLEYCGFEVSEARNGAEALQKAASERPDVIVMDLALPRVDGWEATRRLRAEPATQDVPVVALTGHALGGHEEVARSAGCDAFLTKPCLPDKLVAEIRRLLEQRLAPATSGRVQRAARTTPTKRKIRAKAKSR